jgi:hypothetical protein
MWADKFALAEGSAEGSTQRGRKGSGIGLTCSTFFSCMWTCVRLFVSVVTHQTSLGIAVLSGSPVQ